MRNLEIAQRLEAIADMLAMQSANPFRIRAYQNAARTLRRHGVEAADMIARGEALSELEGIGEDLAGKIGDLVETGTTDIFEELKEETPALAFALLQMPGLGPKRVHALIDELGATTLAQVRRAAREGRVRKVSGFGPKAEAQLLHAMETAETPRRRTIGEAAREAEALATYMRGAPGAAQVTVAGSFRRGRETVGDLDLVVGAAAGPPVIEYFIRFPAMAEMPAAGATRATIVLRTGLQVDLRVVKPESFGAALLYFTGSKAHGVALRAEARGRGMKLNEYGLYRGKRRLAGETEAGIYEALGLDYVPPELREARGEIEAARAHALPRLVGRRNIKGDMHLHHDGEPIAQMIEAAQKQGLSYLTLVSRLDRLGKASLRVRRTEADRAAPPPMRLFHAIEVDIAADGALAASERALKDADFVMAAVNADFDLPRARQTDRLLAAIANPHVAILAHPTCRLLNRRDPLDADWPRVLRAAAEAGVALELTGDPERLDLTDLHCRMARDAGALVALSSDARAQDELDQIHFALTQARRGWLEPRHVLNTVPADKMLARLRTSVRGRSRR